MKILITGATGKVGTRLVEVLKQHEGFSAAALRALCHNRQVQGIEIIRGSISDRDCVRSAIAGVTHVIHLATCKETPDAVMDVAVKGLFWLLEEYRISPTAQQFILLGGDAAVGHFFYKHDGPLTEKTRHMAYPGCYALSKVLEEVMLEQYCIQYGINACCLRAPWIMEKDDFKFSLSFGDDVFGGPVWKELVSPDLARQYASDSTVPLLLDAEGLPLKRNFVHLDDLVAAIILAIGNPRVRRRTFNISMDEPVDYGVLASYLRDQRGLHSVRVPSNYHSNWMDNSAAKYALDWRPAYDLKRLVDAAWDYKRDPADPRLIWYPG
jgi:UDP-glucose 4-epimerase